MTVSYKPQFKVFGDPKFYSNGIAFATHAEAEENAREKYNSWTSAEEYRVVESDEPVNYAMVEGQLTPVKTGKRDPLAGDGMD